jgi:hypothetical protein
MATVNTTLCLPFTPVEQTIAQLTATIHEACQRTCFEHIEEADEVMAGLEDILYPLLYAKLIESITVDFALAQVCFLCRYDAAPEDEDALDIEVLDLVLEPPEGCVISLTLTDPEKAAFLNCLDFEQYATEHVTVTLASSPQDE